MLGGQTVQMEIAALSKPGGRSYNEDSCGYWTSDSVCCYVLSDGAGGHGGGDFASRLAVQTILDDFSRTPIQSAEAIRDALNHANQTIIDHQGDERRLRNMRATVAVLLVDQAARTAQWGHVGDSRIYCFRDGQRLMQTRDHSVVQSIVDAGMAEPDALRNHPQRSLLLSALGSDDDFDPAVADEPMPVLEGDVFLLCSDGLWEYVDEATMERSLSHTTTPQAWLDVLEAEVLQRAERGHDNYSALAVWLGSAEEITLSMGQ
jgi:PPM family protein phosphatase